MKKIIKTVCFPCGNKYDKKHKTAIGAWIGDCDICGEKQLTVADVAHDFGIYSTEDIKIKDKVHDLI